MSCLQGCPAPGTYDVLNNQVFTEHLVHDRPCARHGDTAENNTVKTICDACHAGWANHNLWPRGQQQRQGSIQDTGQEETLSLEEPSGFQVMSRPAFPLLPGPSCGLTPINSVEHLWSAITHPGLCGGLWCLSGEGRAVTEPGQVEVQSQASNTCLHS